MVQRKRHGGAFKTRVAVEAIAGHKTLKGWESLPAETAPAWTVRDGMIVGDGDKGQGYLTFENREIADLEIKLSYRFPGEGNSGISIRARQDKTGKRHFQGLQ